MVQGKNAHGFSVLVATLIVATPMVTFAGPRMIRVNDDGSSQDVTQVKKGNNKTAVSSTDETLSESELVKATSTVTETSDETTQLSETTTQGIDGYIPTVDPDYTPSELYWAGRKWRVNSGATQNLGMDYAIQRSASWQKLRFEVRPEDPSMESDTGKRRAELSGSVYGDKTRLPNGVSLWGAFSTVHHAWSDPEGMSKTYGGVYGQIHMGKPKGNPALAFRRRQNGDFRITSRSEFESSSVNRYTGKLSWNEPHDIVYNVVLHEKNGSLKVWIDGKLVVNYTGGIGHSAADHYWTFGQYFSGGLTSPSVAEYANHVYPASDSLLNRVSQRPTWPGN